MTTAASRFDQLQLPAPPWVGWKQSSADILMFHADSNLQQQQQQQQGALKYVLDGYKTEAKAAYPMQ